jgi:hypothetical protein
MELQHFCNSHPITFTTVQPRHAPATVCSLPAPPLVRRATQEATPLSPPRNILNRANRAQCPNALDYIDTTNIIFEHLRRATLQQRELHNVAMAIADGATAPAWSIDQGLLFFDGHLYLPATSSLLPDLLQVLH